MYEKNRNDMDSDVWALHATYVSGQQNPLESNYELLGEETGWQFQGFRELWYE